MCICPAGERASRPIGSFPTTRRPPTRKYAAAIGIRSYASPRREVGGSSPSGASARQPGKYSSLPGSGSTEPYDRQDLLSTDRSAEGRAGTVARTPASRLGTPESVAATVPPFISKELHFDRTRRPG